jgi:hypothetical protein
MHFKAREICRPILGGIALLVIAASGATLVGYQKAPDEGAAPDPVVARLHEHLGDWPRPIVLAVDSRQFPPAVWKRVKNLVAFRLHRHQSDGMTTVDAAIYLIRDSDLYFKAATTLRNRTTNSEYIWCLLAAVLSHESAHTAPLTERQALIAEAAQLRRCLLAGHLSSGDGWSAGSYLQKVEAKLRHPREHY